MAGPKSTSPVPEASPSLAGPSSPAPFSLPKAASAAFTAAVTGNLASTTKSNAPLDPASIATLATGIVAPKPAVTTVSVSARSTYFAVRYSIAGAASGPIDVEISHQTQAADAQDVLKYYLAMFDGDVAVFTKKTAKPLGQVSLQTDGSVFWVRDCLFVKVNATDHYVPKPSGTPLPPINEPAKPASPPKPPVTPGTPGTKPAGSTPAPPAPAPNPILDNILLPLAAAIDAHLAKFAVAPAAQLKPNTAVKAAAYKGPRGKEFTVALADPNGAHSFKPVEPVVTSTSNAAARIVVPATNGSSAGAYTFLARKVGKGTVKLIVARSDTLAVGAAEVSIEIV
ncbi:hypothetical protein B0T26DRAFT_745041 [Lasiosphaeria miniovina]|uniref:Uncharacterized protein n=1 Tax=Lasiosphaeria miniovina TaxID=1954250 RepID=A0AA40BEX3_9PEZI|nr:uncharacterized protein B0T26DRAFT_745041 [Lasiosphaeria miniovina]KAK0732939.1 hypothetical protein B0T26DRAFT_745041 [Lasiosphaeria miniovina]